MRAALALLLLLLAGPVAAQTAPAPRAPVVVAVPSLPNISAGHAAALGAGMFVGALAGSVMIHGGALATLIGAVAGASIGHWYWTEARDAID
jgi:hypothetical protein